MTTTEEKKEIVGVECRFAFHIPTKSPDIPDVHLIKEVISYADGSQKPNLRFVKDFQRPFYVTKRSHRNHQQKKEYELKENLDEYYCTQSQLRDHVARALGETFGHKPLRQLSNNPYLYGSDISSTTIIKKKYQDRFPGLQTPYSFATLDIETDMLRGTKNPIIISTVFNNHVFIAVDKVVLKGLENPHALFEQRMKKYLGHVMERRAVVDGRPFQYTFHVADDAVDLIRCVFNQLHEWKPDFLAIWNIDFDIPEILKCLKKYGVDPKDILCDPSVPPPLRVCEYKPGSRLKVTASGAQMPIRPAAQWHTLHLTASFYVIDQMCAFRHIRNGEQERSMKLDHVLHDFLGERKLSFKEADKYEGGPWHQFMQQFYILEYCVYNVWDSLSLVELDAVTKDLAFTLPSYSEISDFEMFRSQPKRIVDALHYYFIEEKGYVIASTGKVKRSEDKFENPNVEAYGEGWLDDSDVDWDGEDDDQAYDFDQQTTTLSLRQWIVTLRADLQVLGIRCILEDTALATGFRAWVADSDATSAYPTATEVANVSRGTTKREPISIEGITEDIMRIQNMNLVLGPTNGIQYSTTMYGLPRAADLAAQFKKDMGLV